MDTKTLYQLNQLNQNFYNTVAQSFDQTRQQPWAGWKELVKEVELIGIPQNIVDLGCGNARLAPFLTSNWPNLKKYYGFDTNDHLLTQAKGTLKKLTLDYEVQKLDLVESLLDSTFSAHISHLSSNSTLWCLFGVLHHIPSLELRQNLLAQLAKKMTSLDLMAISCWQFDRSPNLWQRRVDPSHLELPALEKNDFILDWQRGNQAYRYCHLTTETEMNRLALKAGLTIITTWQADGPNDNLNQYYLLQKKA